MTILDTEIEGLKIVQLDVHRDGRGHFLESYSRERYRAAGIDVDFVQDNESLSQRGVLRGMHWQAAPWSQAKLVHVSRGAVWDVAVDLREGSPTFGRHASCELRAGDGRQFFIPRGFAHGFLVLEDDTLFTYKCDNPYRPESERGFRFDDPDVAIPWPVAGLDLKLSPRDLVHPSFAEAVGRAAAAGPR